MGHVQRLDLIPGMRPWILANGSIVILKKRGRFYFKKLFAAFNTDITRSNHSDQVGFEEIERGQ
jgi:hypothetical protein